MEFLSDLPIWAKWLGALAGGLTSITVIWKFGVRSLARALWAAILAAPKIEDSLHELSDILRGDVLGRLDKTNARLDALEAAQEAAFSRGEVYAARLDAHEITISELRTLITVRMRDDAS